jgi:mRNA interferase RelE/StbE
VKVKLERSAAKYFRSLSEPLKSRIKKALEALEKEPMEGDIARLRGRDGFRIRVGGHRIIFDVTEDGVVVYKIGPRGQVYKEN